MVQVMPCFLQPCVRAAHPVFHLQLLRIYCVFANADTAFALSDRWRPLLYNFFWLQLAGGIPYFRE